MLCFANAAGHVVSRKNYLRLDWNKGERTDEDIMEALNKVLDVGRTLRISRLLVNQEIMESCSVEVEVWFKYDWLTRARLQFDNGAAAILSGRNILVRLATVGMLRHLVGWSGHFQIRMFGIGQEDEAIEWLKQLPSGD